MSEPTCGLCAHFFPLAPPSGQAEIIGEQRPGLCRECLHHHVAPDGQVLTFFLQLHAGHMMCGRFARR